MPESIQQTNKMGTRPVFPLLMSMAAPPILSMLIQSLYNIVDSLFVARISTDAMNAVNFAFPIQNLILAVAVGAGVGINSYIARNLGAGDRDEADSAVTHGLILSGIHSLLFIVLGLFCIEPFFHFFTDSPDIFGMGVQYTSIVVFFSFGTIFHIAIEKIFQSMGMMVIPMILQGAGAIINIVLDPLFIFGWGFFPAMGIRGAAIATIIGQISAMSLSMLLFFGKKYEVRAKFRHFRFSFRTVRKIYAVGIPSTIMTALASVLVLGLNALLVKISETAVWVFGIYFKLQTFVYMPANGLVQGARPLFSFNYGAQNRRRVMGTLKYSLLVVGSIMAAGTLLFLVFPEGILRLFNATPEALRMGIPALRIICLSYLVSAVGVVLSSLFESLGKGVQSLTISLLRQFLITLPLAYGLAGPMGLTGIWITFPIAETIAAAVAVFLLGHLLKTDPVLRKSPLPSASR